MWAHAPPGSWMPRSRCQYGLARACRGDSEGAKARRQQSVRQQRARTRRVALPFLVAAITLAGLDHGLGLFRAILLERFADVVLLRELSLFVAARVTTVALMGRKKFSLAHGALLVDGGSSLGWRRESRAKPLTPHHRLGSAAATRRPSWLYPDVLGHVGALATRVLDAAIAMPVRAGTP